MSAPPEKASTPVVTVPPVVNAVPVVETPTPTPTPKPPRTVKEAGKAVPAWLRAHVGEGEGQIAQVVLQRGRALYLQKVAEGAVKNPCYFAMDATRPHKLSDGKLGRRFYVICESDRSFRAISAGHGSGRDLKGIADFANGKTVREELRQCDGIQTDGWRGLCDGRDENVFQRLLPRTQRKRRGFDTLVRPV